MTGSNFSRRPMRLAGLAAAAAIFFMFPAGVAVAAGQGSATDNPIGKRVPLTGPLTEDEPDAGTHVPFFRPNCRWRTERYYHPDKGWRSQRVLECR